MAPWLTGKLLIATPALMDPNFQRTVVAVANHDNEGALGVVLNRPSDTTVSEAVPDLAELVEDDDVVHVGGPVQPEAIVVLAQFVVPGEAAYVITGDIGLVGDRTGIDRLGEVSARRRVFAGYAGWGPGQLEAEIERDDWILGDALPEDVFSEAPLDLWAEVLDRKGGKFRLLARMPDDPSLN